jgi:hypothetical protein
MDHDTPSKLRRFSWGMAFVILLTVGSLAGFAHYLIDVDSVFLVPAIAAAVFVVMQLARRNVPASSEATRHLTSLVVFLLFALLTAALGMGDFRANGWANTLMSAG